MLAGILAQLLPPEPTGFDHLRLGAIIGAGAVIAVIIILKLAQWWFCTRGRSAGVAIRNEHGTLFITADAIADLARAVCQEYSRLELAKVALRQDKNGLSLELNLDTECAEESLTVMTESLQKRILAEMQEHFGIATVRRIDVRVRHLLAPHGKTS